MTRRSQTNTAPGTGNPGHIRIWEYVGIGAIVAISWIVYLRFGRYIWFHADYWGLLIDHDPSLHGLIEPHAGHLVVFHVAATQLTYLIAGLDAWKWLIVIRILIWTLLVGVTWFVARRRGALPVVAMGYAASISVFGLSGWVMGWLVGNPIAITAVIAAAYLIERTPMPSVGQRIGVGVLGVVAVASTGVGVVGFIALAIGTAAVPAARKYIVPLTAGAAVYLSWYVFARGSGGGQPMDFTAIRDIPWNGFQIAIDGLATYLGVSFALGGALLVCLLVAVGASFWRYRPSVFDLIMMVWAGGFIALVSMTRIAAGQAQVQANRYEYLVVLAILAIAIPRLRWTPRDRRLAAAATIAVVVAALFVTSANVGTLETALTYWQGRSHASQQVIEAAGWMLDREEPYVDAAAIDFPRAGMLTAGGLKSLAVDGWDPPPPHDNEVERTARGDIRLHWSRRMAEALSTCSQLERGEVLSLRPVPFSVTGAGSAEVVVEYRDRYGLGSQSLQRDGSVYPVPDPSGTVAISIEVGTATVCGDVE